jgi:hypothetical protein
VEVLPSTAPQDPVRLTSEPAPREFQYLWMGPAVQIRRLERLARAVAMEIVAP